MSIALATAIIASASALIGVLLGGVLSGRNEKRAATERLFVEALNDVVNAFGDKAKAPSADADARYGGAVSRLALHGSPKIVQAFSHFKDDTHTAQGRRAFIDILQEARKELGLPHASDDDLATVLFGARLNSDADTDVDRDPALSASPHRGA